MEKKKLLNTPLIRPLALFYLKLMHFKHYYKKPIGHLVKDIFFSNEIDNFSFDLTDVNLTHLSGMIAYVTKVPIGKIEEYIEEITNDYELSNHINERLKNAPKNTHLRTNAGIKYSRRVGWYCMVRAVKPKVVIETGIHSGIGSCILSSALLRNIAEGYEGQYIGTDIMETAGYLYNDSKYSKVGEILYGDSIESLRELNIEIDFFINDSDHSSKYEADEYVTIKDKLAQSAYILGDNSHVTKELYKFSKKNGLDFLFFSEKPKNHWYPGGGIGIAIKN